MIRTSTGAALVAAAGCLLLAGCGPTKASPAAANPPATSTPAATAPAPAETTAAAAGGGGLTACTLITEQDASSATGTATGPGTPGGGAALSECIYGGGSLIIGMKTDATAMFDKSYSDATAKGAKDLPGIGDRAFEAGQHGFSTLELLKGTTLVSILYGGPDALNTSIAIAKVAAGKL